jgi:hypothetical protein
MGLSSPTSCGPPCRVGEVSLALDLGVDGVSGYWKEQFLAKEQEDFPSHLFLVLLTTEGKRANTWAEKVALGRAGSKLYVPIAPPNLMEEGVSGYGRWAKEDALSQGPEPLLPNQGWDRRASERRCWSCAFWGRQERARLQRDSSENPRHCRNRRNWLQLVKMPGICTLLCDLKQK